MTTRPQHSPSKKPATPGLILWVDEDADLVRRIGESAGWESIEVVGARSQAEALGVAKSRDLSGAVINTQLESANAFQLARMLRAVPGYDALPLAFASAENVPEDHVASAMMGARVLLTKTTSPESVLQGLRDLVRARDAQRPRILLVEGDAPFAADTVALLRVQGWVGHVLDDPSRVQKTIADQQPHLLLLDTTTPGYDAIGLCKELRAAPNTKDLPIVFLTAENDPETRIAVFRAGGDDYITKPVIPEELTARLAVRLDRARLRKERMDIDALSGLLLRKPFIDAMLKHVAYAQRHKAPLTLSLIDVDGIKGINNEHGRLSGDQVIATIGSVLQQTFRAEDLRCRWGGQEFMIGFLGSRPDVIETVMGNLLTEFAGIPFESESGKVFTSRFTVGVASLPEDGDILYDLIQVAEQRRTQGKQVGGGVVVGRETGG